MQCDLRYTTSHLCQLIAHRIPTHIPSYWFPQERHHIDAQQQRTQARQHGVRYEIIRIARKFIATIRISKAKCFFILVLRFLAIALAFIRKIAVPYCIVKVLRSHRVQCSSVHSQHGVDCPKEDAERGPQAAGDKQEQVQRDDKTLSTVSDLLLLAHGCAVQYKERCYPYPPASYRKVLELRADDGPQYELKFHHAPHVTGSKLIVVSFNFEDLASYLCQRNSHRHDTEYNVSHLRHRHMRKYTLTDFQSK